MASSELDAGGCFEFCMVVNVTFTNWADQNLDTSRSLSQIAVYQRVVTSTLMFPNESFRTTRLSIIKYHIGVHFEAFEL